MPKLGEQPTSINRERFDKNEENSENIKKQLHEAMASGDADKIIELGGQMKELKAKKEEFKGQDEREAYEQNAKIEDQKEAIDMNKQFDEAKAAEEAAKEKARIAEEIRIQAESEAAQLAAVRAKINGGGSEENIAGDSKELLDEALKLESGGDFFMAAVNFEKGGNKEKALENWEKSAQELEKEGNTIGSAEHYEKSGNTKAANRMFEAYAKKLDEWGSPRDAERIRKERIKNGSVENAETFSSEIKQEKAEDIYGMNLEKLAEVIKKQGYPETPAKVGDPQFKEKMDKFNADRLAFMQARVKLFDKVLAGKASEEEMKIAMDHAAEQAKNYGLEGFNSAVPKNWYTNERLLEAMAATSPQNAKFIEYVKKNVSKEKLANYFEKIDNDGQVRTYEHTA